MAMSMPMPLKKFTAYGSSPSLATYPSLPDHITWMRLFLGLAYGISLGFRENRNDVTLQGTIGLIFGLNVITFLPIMYLNLYLNAQTDSYKGLNFVGVPNALALMMLVWIIFFTMAHEEEEIAFGNAFIQSVVKSAVGDDSDGDVVAEIVAPVQVEDSEF